MPVRAEIADSFNRVFAATVQSKRTALADAETFPIRDLIGFLVNSVLRPHPALVDIRGGPVLPTRRPHCRAGCRCSPITSTPSRGNSDWAAPIDGCSRFGLIFRIIYPVAVPGLVVGGLFAFVVWWGDHLSFYILSQDQGPQTLPIARRPS